MPLPQTRHVADLVVLALTRRGLGVETCVVSNGVEVRIRPWPIGQSAPITVFIADPDDGL
jgi:hypothetical protein